MAIRGLLDARVASIIQQLQQTSHAHDARSGNVQILEKATGG